MPELLLQLHKGNAPILLHEAFQEGLYAFGQAQNRKQSLIVRGNRSRNRLCGTAGAALLVIAAALSPVFAQGLESAQTIETIIGSEVQEEESQSSADIGKAVVAIESTRETIRTVRKTSNLDTVDIVFLGDAAAPEGGPPPEIDEKIKEHEDDIAELRQELEGNAMLYHAIDSRQVRFRDILAVEFDDAKGVVIYAAAKPAE
jgi:hypothetical protein